MRGIILAAGTGLRLNGAMGNTPKCLLEIGGQTLLARQIQALRNYGVEDIVVIIGYEGEQVRQACDAAIRFVENLRFNETNSLYSLWLAREYLRDGFVVLNSDVLFHPQLLTDLLSSPYENALLMAPSHPGSTVMGEEEMKVKVRDGRVLDISKTMNPREADGENLGLVKFGPSGALLLVEQMEALIASGRQKDWAPRAFCEFAARRPLHAIDIRGLPWIEIDYPTDYWKAINETFPAITLSLAGIDVSPTYSVWQHAGTG